jgi:hypothetical protein
MSGTALASVLSSTAISAMSSFSLVSERSRSSTLSSTLSSQAFSLVNDSDSDEIVWDISSDYHSNSAESSDPEDFVVLRRSTPNPAQPSSAVSDALTSDLSRLSLKQSTSTSTPARPAKLSSPAKKVSATFAKDDSPPLTPVSKKRGRRRAKKESKAVGLGSRPIVDDVSESTEDFSTDLERDDSSVYEEAVEFITSFLRNPSAYAGSSSRLTLLQSLIIELGLSCPSMPGSMTSARTLLKSQAFLNIREYLAVRDQGMDAVKQAMYPSRSALIKSIRKRPQSRASLGWVKEHGLQVLLVAAYRH